jgi:iron complex outermembrane receptor protein
MKQTSVVLILLILPFRFACSQSFNLGQIIVKRDNSTYNIIADNVKLTLEDYPAFSAAGILQYSSAIDLRQRNLFGIQQDLYIRGGSYEDSIIKIEGIQINNPQTGHFNLELPLTDLDLGQVNIYKNSQTLNFSLAAPGTEGGVFKSGIGSHALRDNLVSVNFNLGAARNRLSLQHKNSKGSSSDTDFAVSNINFYSISQCNDIEFKLFAGLQKKDFGAGNFYSASYPHQQEHLQQSFFLLKTNWAQPAWQLTNDFYFMRLADKFILNKYDPSFYTNYHTSYLYGYKNKVLLNNQLFFAFNLREEVIDSTNLGSDSRRRHGLELGIEDKRIGNFLFNASFGIDYYQYWHNLEKASLSLRYPLASRWITGFSYTRRWRIPSFTELYYNSPTNIGNQQLQEQSWDNFQLEVNYLNQVLNANTALFLRRHHRAIDWQKDLRSDPWRVQNVSGVDFYGIDCNFSWDLGHFLKKVNLQYSYLNSTQKPENNFSKYLYDYNKHKILGQIVLSAAGVKADLIANFIKPAIREQYFTLDCGLTKKINKFSLAFKALNLFNHDYYQLQDIKAPGRWLYFSVSYHF